ncbi:adenylate/guanylate cyclase domain-containing protein [Nocardioides pelophilus]|uniref:adenylate/guanylate cyclase domain-containing protein n=1 Tax=Nocardioides pelophilus TaxID=2172019 RepID=UPI00160080A0|nr:alpha/beta fold hydrolase [Nocardioides pelophilus]
MRPKTGYARNGDVRIAYQVVGDGPFDLVMTPPYISHVDLWWMLPETARFMERLASFCRLILYDKRGTGLSDPSLRPPSLEERVEDLHAVLDATGAERPALFGISEGGVLSMLFAAAYPERVRALITFGAFAKMPGPDYLPDLVERAERAMAAFDEMHEHWGEGHLVDLFAPDYAEDEATRASLALFERLAASPAMAVALLDSLRSVDATHVLSSISAPTLVMHRRDEVIPVEMARDIAARIPGARLLELDGTSHLPWLGDSEAVHDGIEAFLTGARAVHEPDRALVTVVFTDIVGSTDLAGRLGDARWRALLERHDAFVTHEVDRAGGHVVKSLGDGMLARFDGPARALRAARRIVTSSMAEVGVEVRAGVHTGECEIRGDDLGGMAVHIGARVAAKAAGGEVLVSSAVRDLVFGSPIGFEDRGDHELKGVPGRWRLLAVTDAESAPQAPAPAAAYAIAPNGPSSRTSDRAVARMAKVGSANPKVGRQLGRALRLGTRLRRPSVSRP